MADINNPDTFCRQTLHNAEEMFHFVFRKRAGRLIEHKNFCIIGNCLTNFHHLTFGNGKLADNLLRINIYFKTLENLFGFLVHFLFVYYSKFVGRKTAQPHVFHDIPTQNLVKFLMHHRHSVIKSITGAGKCHRLPVHCDSAAIERINAEKAFHQCRFSCAIFSHECMDCTRSQFQHSMVKSLDPWELLINIYHFQQKRFCWLFFYFRHCQYHHFSALFHRENSQNYSGDRSRRNSRRI